MTGEAPIRLFLDRSTQGRRFVAAVRALVDDVETIVDRYGAEAAPFVRDPVWIADATSVGRILVGADRYILRNKLERQRSAGTGPATWCSVRTTSGSPP